VFGFKLTRKKKTNKKKEVKPNKQTRNGQARSIKSPLTQLVAVIIRVPIPLQEKKTEKNITSFSNLKMAVGVTICFDFIFSIKR
jgi:hypothetical protein